MKQVLVLGAGATALEIGEALAQQQRRGADVEVLGFLDDDPRAQGLPERDLPVLGGLDQVHRFRRAYFVLGVTGYLRRRLRRELIERLGLPPERYHTLVHPSAQVSGTASLGPGCALLHNALVGQGVLLGAQVLVAQGCCLGHDTEVGSCTVFAPGVTVCGRTRIGEDVYVGAGATTAPGIEIGSGALIGIGSVVLESVEADTTVFGNPARVVQKGALRRWAPGPGAPGTDGLEDRIRQLAAGVLRISPDSLGADSHRGQIPEWDSLQHLDLVVALEQEFDIEITPDDFEVMSSFPGMLHLVTRKLAARV